MSLVHQPAKMKHDNVTKMNAKNGEKRTDYRKGLDPMGQSNYPVKQRVAKTVIFGGLNDEMVEDLHKLAREIGEVCSVTYPFSVTELQRYGLSRDGCRENISSVVYSSISSARKSVEMLHKKEIKGNVVWARQLGGEGSKTMKWKIIVRNLPFKMDKNEIRDMFLSAGFVWDVLIPCNSKTGLSKGFAFIKFTSKQHTENAIRKFNGQKFSGRTIAVDWAVPKNVYTANTNISVSSEETKEGGVGGDDNGSSDFENEDSHVNQKSVHVSDIEPGDSHMEEDEPLPEVDNEEEEKVAKKVLETLFASVKEKPPIIVDADQRNRDIHRPNIKSSTVSDFVDSGKNSRETESAALKIKVLDDDLQTTLFIGNIPFDANKEDILERFSAFGDVRSFVPVFHEVTKRPKGTGFLKFHKNDAAGAAVSYADDTTGLGIFIKGRKLRVLKALDKKSVHIKEIEKVKNRENHDHRNLYLAKEGLIVEGTPAAEGVSTSDMAKRKMLQKKKETKLNSPIFHISKTRLMIYNVPKSMTEKEVKKICIEAVKSRATRENPVILQVKIMKDSKNLKDGSTKIRPRGIAFVQFTEHQHAIVAIRVLNNNPETFGEEHRPIVEFSIDNVHKLKQRKEKTEQHQVEKNGSKTRRDDGRMKEKENKNKNKKENVERIEKVKERVDAEIGETKKRKWVVSNGDVKKEKKKKNGENDDHKLDALIQQYKINFSSFHSHHNSKLTTRWFE